MITRILTGIAMFFIIFLPGTLLSHTFVLPVICGILSCFGVYEIIKCFGLHRNNPILIASMSVGLCLPILVRYTFLESGLVSVALLLMFYVFYMFALPVFTNNEIPFDDIAKYNASSLFTKVYRISVM